MNTITINGKEYRTPACWNELSREQLLAIADLFDEKLSKIHFKVKLIYRIMKLKAPITDRIDIEDMMFMARTVNFVLDAIQLTRNLIPMILVKGRRYYGPADSMTDCTFGEMTRAQVKLEDYIKTNDLKYLDEMVAILYRPKKFAWWLRCRFTDSTDARVKYREKDVASRAGRIRNIDPAIKTGVYIFFTGVLNSLPDRFPNLYREKAKNTKNPNAWASLIIALADGKTDDESLEKVFNSNMYNVFLGMEQKAIDYYKFLKEINHDD